MAQKPAGSIPGSRETSSLARYAYMRGKGKDTVKILPVPARVLPRRYSTSRNGTPYTDTGFASAWQRVMKKFVAAGNERFHEHDIRGKVATDIDDPLAAQKLLGHQSIKMTEDYIKQRKADEVMPHGRKQCT